MARANDQEKSRDLNDLVAACQQAVDVADIAYDHDSDASEGIWYWAMHHPERDCLVVFTVAVLDDETSFIACLRDYEMDQIDDAPHTLVTRPTVSWIKTMVEETVYAVARGEY